MALPASDNFNRANGGLGSNWTTVGTALGIVSNQAKGTVGGAYHAARWNADTWPADQWSSATIATIGDVPGVAVRVSTTGAITYYYGSVDSAGFGRLYERIAGNFPQLLATDGGGWSAGDVLTVVVVGSRLRMFRGSTLVLSHVSTTITAGAAGLAAQGTGGALDSWSGGAASGPTAPAGLAATVQSGPQVVLTWSDASSTEAGFAIERDSGGGFAQIATVAANTATYTDTSVSGGTTYTYRVLAFSTTGDSGYSNTASATVPALPAAPSGLTATATGLYAVALAWVDNAATETGFKVERDSGGGYSQIATTGAGITTYTDGAVAAATAYTYRVRAYNATGNSGYSNTASATTFSPPTPAPTPPTLTCRIAWPNGPYDASPTWTDLSPRLRNDVGITIVRGRQQLLGRIEAGYTTLGLHNRDRALDPFNAASAYAPYVIPGRRLNLRATESATTYDLFTGYTRMSQAYGPGGSQDAYVNVRAVDALGRFAVTPLQDIRIVTWDAPSPLVLNDTIYYSPNPYLVPGGAQVKVALASAPPATGVTIRVWGDIRSTPGEATVYDYEQYLMTPSNYTGVIGARVFVNVGAIQSIVVGGSDHRPVTLTGIPGYPSVTDVEGIGLHIKWILDYIGWPSALRALDNSDVAPSTWSATQQTGWSKSITAGVADTILTALQRLAETEGGLVFIRGDGAVVFHSRGRRTSTYNPAPLVFGPGSSELPYSNPTFVDGDDDVITEVRLTRASGAEHRAAADDAVVALVGRRPYAQGGLLSLFGTRIESWAGRLAYHYSRPLPRLASFTCDAPAVPYATLLGLDLSQIVVVRFRPPGGGAIVEQASFIERLEWRISRGKWQCTVGVSPARLGNDLYHIYGV